MYLSETSHILVDPSSDPLTTPHQYILVVEDDEETAEYLQVLLSDAGYRVTVAANGQQALQFFRSEPPDVILMDLGLPGIDGFAVTELIRASARVLPILMLTAEAETSAKLRSFDVGADDYVLKPFSGPELLARIAAQIRKHHIINELEEHQSALKQELAQMIASQRTLATSVEMERSMRIDLLHSVNTHLQSLCSVLDAEFRRQPPGAGREALLRIIPRIHGAALVYQVAEHVTGETLDFSELLQTIANSLKHVYSPRKRIPVRIETDTLIIPSASASPLAMITTELITNAFKHAFPHGRFGAIDITCSLSGDMLSLDIVDDGVGLDAEQQEKRGLASVRQLIGSMNGTFNLLSNPNGTRAEVRLPIEQAAPAITQPECNVKRA